MLFDNLTIRLLGSDDFPAAAKQQAVTDLTEVARTGDLTISASDPFPLHRAAAAHDQVNTDNRRRVLLAIPD
jgi:NADPH2:quinone reductase